MIEILSSELSQCIQLVGLGQEKGRWVPKSLLFAFREDLDQGRLRLRPAWLRSGPGVPQGALEDLASEWSLKSISRGPAPASKRCPMCGASAGGRLITSEGQPLCAEHLAPAWEERLVAASGGAGEELCGACGLGAMVLWHGKNALPRCTRCFVQGVQDSTRTSRWMVVGGPALPPGALGEIRVFLKAWRLVESCERCGSRSIRIRRLLLDFPKAHAPLYPLWELRREDLGPEKARLRERQVRIFTQGLLSVTLECPQCGYMEREFEGVEVEQGGRGRFSPVL